MKNDCVAVDTQMRACTRTFISCVLNALTPFFVNASTLDWHDRNVRYLPKCSRYYGRYWFLWSLAQVPHIKKKCYKIYCLIVNIYFWYLDIPVHVFSFLFLAHFSLIPHAFSGLVTRGIWVSTLSSGLSKDTRATSGQIRFEARRSCYLLFSGWKRLALHPPLRVFRSQINLPASNVDFTLAIRCVSMSTLDLSSDWTHKGNNLCSKNKSNKLTKQTEQDRERREDELPLRI